MSLPNQKLSDQNWKIAQIDIFIKEWAIEICSGATVFHRMVLKM